jgi:hypothetical protein
LRAAEDENNLVPSAIWQKSCFMMCSRGISLFGFLAGFAMLRPPRFSIAKFAD